MGWEKEGEEGGGRKGEGGKGEGREGWEGDPTMFGRKLTPVTIILISSTFDVA